MTALQRLDALERKYGGTDIDMSDAAVLARYDGTIVPPAHSVAISDADAMQCTGHSTSTLKQKAKRNSKHKVDTGA